MATHIGPLMANVRLRIGLSQATHIKRSLIGSGVITVSKGSQVAPQDIIGRSNQSSGYSSVPLAKQLGESPANTLKYLQKALNSTIFKGELLALKKGLFSQKEVFAPTDGLIEKYDTSNGQLRIKFLIKQLPLTAGVFGIVDEVDKEKGDILIKTMATVVHGALGFGFQRGGILESLESGSPIIASQITPSLGQRILVVGSLISNEVLKKAANFGVPGIISGGINTSDYRAMVGSLDLNERLERDVGLTILATEGFGPLSLGEDISKLLKTYEGKFVFLDGNLHRIILPNFNSNSLINLGKISLPAPKAEENIREYILGELEVGRKVRFIRSPQLGLQGEIIGIDRTPTLLESGISTYMITVETEHKKFIVPFPNIELISEL